MQTNAANTSHRLLEKSPLTVPVEESFLQDIANAVIKIV